VLNVRSGPGLQYPVINELAAGTAFTVIGQSSDGGWLFVVLPSGNTGWIDRFYTDFTGTAEVIAAPPLPAAPTPTPTLVPTATPTTPVITDWLGQYYANPNLSGDPVLVRNDTGIGFNWGTGSPDPSVPSTYFSARWTRTWNFPADATYRFHAVVDDGVRVYVDGNLVINDWRDGSQREDTGDITLSAGPHDLRVEYYQAQGVALIYIWWEQLPVPSSGPTWTGEYFANQDLSGAPALIRSDPSINFNWGLGSPASNLPADHFSVRWTGTFTFDPAYYEVAANADDGIRVTIDGNLVIDQWHDNGGFNTYTADMPLSGTHTFVVEYYEDTGFALVNVRWYPIAAPTPTPTFTPTATPTLVPTATPTATATPTLVPTFTPSATPTLAPTPTNTPAPTTQPTNTPTNTPAPTAQPTNTPTNTPAPTAQPTNTPTNTPAPTAQPTNTPTNTPAPTTQPTNTPTNTPAPTAQPTNTPRPANTPRPTNTPKPTNTPRPTSTPTPIPAPTATPVPPVAPVQLNEIFLGQGASISGIFPVQVGPAPSQWIDIFLGHRASISGIFPVQEGPASSQWIELYNRGPVPVGLGGWTLAAQDPAGAPRYQLPGGTMIPAGGYLVFYGSQTGITLTGRGSRLTLIDQLGRQVDSVVIGTISPGDSYSRDSSGAWHGNWPPTPGRPNSPRRP